MRVFTSPKMRISRGPPLQGITIKAKLSEGVVHKQPLEGFLQS